MPLIIGETNLPNGTKVLVSVERPEIGYGGDYKSVVNNGKFQAGPFGSRNSDLRPGKYLLTVTMTSPFMQPDEVQLIIGKSGEKLKGKLIQNSHGGKHAVYTGHIYIKGDTPKTTDAQEKRLRLSEDLGNFCHEGCKSESGGISIFFERCMQACTAK